MFKLIDSLFDELYPLNRSILGKGIEQSIDIIARYMPLEKTLIPSGTKVFDWEVPLEWECSEAKLTAADGAVIVDYADCNLNLINYSQSLDRYMDLDELLPHLYSLPHLPEAIPYVTSYYKPEWGFCLPDKIKNSLKPGTYHAKIDSHFKNGNIIVADTLLQGDSPKEIMLSSYLCHPSLANNELSGPLVLLGLYLRLAAWKTRRFSYRFVLHPETIGSLCYLYKKGDHLKQNVISGMILTCLGGPLENFNYKTSRQENALVDKLAYLWQNEGKMAIRPFTPCHGSDERQYCSPGFNLPIGQMTRTTYAYYDSYHSSLDNKEFMTIESLIKSIDDLEIFLKELDHSGFFLNLSPYGEPHLGKHGLYPNINHRDNWADSGDEIFDSRDILNRLLTILSYSDGCFDMIDIAEKCGTSVSNLIPIIKTLEEKNLLKFSGGKKKGCLL